MISRSKPAVKTQKKSPAQMKAKNRSTKTAKVTGRDASFPRSKNPETQNILVLAEENWDPSVNDGMILPGDRELVSDYVFLTLRQLKIAMPTKADFAKGRRGPATQRMIPGMCCMHCDGKDASMVATSSRTFPTAPDNYASAFNTQLYNHMQNCSFVPSAVKKALQDLKKLHSNQIAHLKVGSQRQFFALLYNRIRKAKGGGDLQVAAVSSIATPTRASRKPSVTQATLLARGRPSK